MSDWTGLTSAEVVERVARGQVNRVRRSDLAEYWDLISRNLFTLFNALVVPAAIALFFLGDYRGAFAVSGMALINTVLGLAQEFRAKRHLDQLMLLAEARARVLRDGQVTEVLASDVVLDDIIQLAPGDSVVADGLVLEAQYLEVDEALLTGESDPVSRKPGDELLSGSFCVAGTGIYRATRVGGSSFAQDLSTQARSYAYVASPIQQSINLLLRILSITAVVLCLLYLVFYQFRMDLDRTKLVQMVAATITSMVPQGLVLMTTLAFILGAVRMAHRGAVVQHLAAVETMASIDVLCMDKTGTLTTNQLKLYQVRPLGNSDEQTVRERLRDFAWGSMDIQNKSILALRVELGKAEPEVLDRLPFKSQNRFSAVRVRSHNGDRVLVLGAFEALESRLSEGQQLAREAWREMTATGLRLLLFAESEQAGTFSGSLEGIALRPLALVALSDELRSDAGQVLEELAGQGIRFKILSGDNPDTVRATIATLNLPLGREPVVSGSELANAPNRAELIRTRSVFGRVAPKQKLEIVETLQRQGAHVAMIGDGVNDVLPLKRADLGIAMGSGSRAARIVSGLVLERDRFELLPETLEEGRTILRNLRRSAKLFLLKNVYTLILIVGAFMAFGKPFPYLPQQVTLLNFLTIGVPALVITLTRERSTRATRPGFLGEVLWFAIRTGIVIGLTGLILFAVSDVTHPGDERTQRTMLLSCLVLLGVSALLRVLTDGEVESLRGDTQLRWLALGALPIYAFTVYVPFANDFFQLTPLSLRDWGVVLLAAGPGVALSYLSDRIPMPGIARPASRRYSELPSLATQGDRR